MKEAEKIKHALEVLHDEGCVCSALSPAFRIPMVNAFIVHAGQSASLQTTPYWKLRTRAMCVCLTITLSYSSTHPILKEEEKSDICLH